MKVKITCINNNLFVDDITIGKVYEGTWIKGMYVLTGDRNKIVCIVNDKFMVSTKQDIRDGKIDSLLNG